MKSLGGWQRIGIILAALWWLGIAVLAGYDFAKHQEGTFTFLEPPAGTIVSGETATLPDGRKIDLNVSIGGESVKPWEIKWDNEPEVPTVVSIRWQCLASALLLPVVLWLLLALTYRVVLWVRAGFRAGAA